MEALLIVIFSALTGGIVWLISHARQAPQKERLRATLEDNARLAGETQALRVEVARISTVNTQLSTQLGAERDAQSRLTNEFKALSADALSRNNTSFLDLAREAFAKLQQQSTGDLEKRQQAIDALVKPLRESLHQVDTKLAAIETRARKPTGH